MDTATRDPRQIAPPAPPPAEVFGDYGPAVTGAAALILVLAISVIDKLTGYDLQIGVLNLVPIAMVTWAVGRVAGVAFAVLAVGLWLLMFRGSVEARVSLYFYWDAAVLFGTFLAFVAVIGRLRDALGGPEIHYLDELSAPAYVVDAAGTEILYRNAAFRDSLGDRTAEDLERYPAIESEIRWSDARKARLRILTV
jgi:hypothetical protein